MRLGTSSPKISVTKVMPVTTRAVAEKCATRSGAPASSSQRATMGLKAESPTMPLSRPIEVMPTCTVERKFVGCSIKASAADAPGFWAAASASSRALRLAASAISDMANRPLSRVNNKISSRFMACADNDSCRPWRATSERHDRARAKTGIHAWECTASGIFMAAMRNGRPCCVRWIFRPAATPFTCWAIWSIAGRIRPMCCAA